MSKEILSRDENHLSIFEDGVAINKSLLKWRRAEDGIEKTKSPKKNVSSYLVNNNENMTPDMAMANSEMENDVDSNISSSPQWLPLYQTPEGLNFDEIATAGIKDLTRLLVEKKVKYVMGGYGSFGSTVTNLNYSTTDDFEVEYPNEASRKKKNKNNGKLKQFFSKLFGDEKQKKEKYEFDAIKFFSLVKATTNESAFTYKDRVSKYLRALHNAVDIGQTALQEELLKGLITNKYESLLYAEGYYKVIDEKTMVDFVKKCEKGLSLDYIKNFSRPIPENVAEKISKLNELEIFDNYVVLHYDPKKTAFKETEYEIAKRKDPIIFGLIAGSRNLYYVTDWIDEFCDLTLEKFVDTLGIDEKSLYIKDE